MGFLYTKLIYIPYLKTQFKNAPPMHLKYIKFGCRVFYFYKATFYATLLLFARFATNLTVCEQY